MFSTKLEVDRHVENCLKKINSETERNLRCLAFAKLYFKVGEYEQARRYISSYLSAKPLSAEGQLLLGKILEKLGKKEAALEAYRSSLELDPKQNNLIIKICELLANDDMSLDVSTAKYFSEKAQALDPHNPSVFTLKQRLVTLECKDPNEVTKLLLTELETRPTDIKLRIKLLRHLLHNNQIKEAYKHAADIEERNLSMFLNNLTWYETVAEVLMRYQRHFSFNGSIGHEFWMLWISVLDKLTSLSLEEHSDHHKSSADCVAAVFSFDQTLTLAAQHLNSCNDRHLTQEFLCHYRGQLCFHLAVLMYKQAKKDLLKFKEVTDAVLPLLFVAYHSQPTELSSIWLKHTSESKREQMKRWHREAAYRCSQAGHIILAEVKERKHTIVEKALLHSSGLWREQLFKKLFVTREQQSNMKNSYFVNCPQIADVVIKLPETADVLLLDDEAQLVHPDSLHHYIWLCLNQELNTFKCTSFPGLQYSVKDLKNCAAETLCILDIQAFIYCASLCAKVNIENSKDIHYNNNRPSVLPADISECMGTVDQVKWFTAAYKMYRNEYGGDLGEIRLRLIKGIEVIRCVGNHGLDVKLLVILADTFAECAKKSNKQSEIEGNESRAELYWRTALPLLERMKSGKLFTPGGKRLFQYETKEMTMKEILTRIDCGKLFIATQLMKQKEHEKALQLLEHLKDPYASYYQANIYKAMAEEQLNQNKNNLTPQMQNQYIILLTKARDSLYLTLDRLRDPSVDRKHILNTKLGNEIEEVEHALARMDSDISNRNESEDLDESISTIGGGVTPSYSLSQNSFLNGSLLTVRNDSQFSFSTPSRRDLRTEARPSPERLDGQLRQLIASKDAAISQMMDQNRIIVDSHRCLVDELKGFREAVKGLTSAVGELQTIKHTVEELKGIKDVVEELKTSVDELQNFRNVQDVVYEMKKEISELKKDTHKGKGAQLSDEDLYPLDEEFGNDYNIGSAVAGFNPNLYPQGRLPGTGSFTYGPPLYSPMYQMAPYHYGLGLPQAGALPFGAEQQIAAELRAMNSLPQNLGQSSLAQGNYAQSMLFPSLGQPLAQTTLSSANLLPNQSTGPNLFKDAVSSAAATNVFSTIPANTFPLTMTTSASNATKSAPVNVVITASDPLPTGKATGVQPILSVTIPPQHLKGNLPPKPQPHNYQIPLPATSVAAVSTPSVLNQSTIPVTTQSILSNVAPPVYSAIPEKSPGKSTGLGLQIEKSLSQSFSSNTQLDLNKSNVSVSSLEEIDPCPDFKPIIPLPAEVPVNTGEENETVLFCERAKLYRYVNKEWRERGVGNIKILHNPETNKVRILMRRDQVHKICANHFLTKDMTLSPMSSADRAYIWAANDFADQEVVLEKFCARFKTVEEAKKFYDAFESALKLLTDESPKKIETVDKKPTPVAATTATTTAAAATFGGFVFTSTPTFKPKEDKPPLTETTIPDTPKASPFADFSFGSKISATAATPTLLPSFKSDFIPVQKETTTSPAVSAETPRILSSPGGDDHSGTEFESTAEFKPVVPLPAVVDVKTGEENAEVLHECRAKLLRYDATIKEWKERGIGNMKILKEDKIIRLLMRREQVHKVCCNHQLLKNMNFSKFGNNPRAISWCAQDFSEEILKTEMFALRFKTEEQAEEFLNALHAAQASLNDNNVLQEKTIEKKEERNQHAKMKTEPEKPFDSSPKQSSWGERFKPKSGSWNCKTCFVVNEGKDNYCVACETPKNDSLPKKEVSDASGPTFSFTVPSFTSKPDRPFDLSKTDSSQSGQKTELVGFGDKFKPKEGSWSCNTCLVVNNADKLYCVSCESPKDDTVPKKESNKGVNLATPGVSFRFGIPPSNSSKFSFGSETTQSPGFSFGTTTANTEKNFVTKPFVFTPPEQISTTKKSEEEKETSKEKFVFGSPQKHSFEFTPRSPRKLSGGHGEDESDGSFIEEEADNIYFKPVIPLPDKVEVKTGEEGEEVLYCHRAKLFRFADGEWKERGIGDVKILFHPTTKKLRVLMRREQVLKICLNHVLTSDIEYRQKDDKTWLFCAPDFSEGEIDHQKFCIRFKNGEVARDFKEAVTNSLKKICDEDEREADSKADSDVEVVFETKVTPEEEKEAVKLGLPPKFFAYKQLPDCTCEQCKKDDVYLKELFEDNPKPQRTSILFGTPSSVTGSSFFGTPKSTLHVTSTASPFVTPTASSFTSSKAPTTVSSLTSTPVSSNTSQSGVIERLLVKPSILATMNTSTETPKDVFKSFSFTLNPSTTTTTTNASDTSKPVFGGGSFAFGPKTTSIFGNPAATTSNVFGLASSTTSSATSIFGSAATSTSSLFGSNSSLFNSSNTSLFSTGLSKTSGNGESIFGTPSSILTEKSDSKTTFGSSTIFGSNTSSLPNFGAIAANNTEEKTTATSSQNDIILPSDPNLTFASLAASSQDKPVFGKKADDGKNPFEFLGAGAPVFGGASKQVALKKVDKEQVASGDEGESDGAEEYDPHYEPIVPLPAAIVVSTGEEEETQSFNERAKLYRYDADTKEWKERGVGQMKLLHHPVNNTYRLLLRREQVHKVVLNQLITPDLDLQPLSSSDKAWCWAGYNYTDDGSNLEKLAVRFKNSELSKQFFDAVQNAIVAVKEYQASKCLPSTIQNYGVEDVSGDENQPVDDDEEDEDDDDEDDRSVMCAKRCTLSEMLDSGTWKEIAMGDLQVYYDPELYGAKIAVNDDNGRLISNTIIGVNTVMEMSNNECWWRAVEWANEELQWKTLKATFSSAAAAEEFYCTYKEGVNYAQECDIVDEIPTEHSEEVD